MVCVKKSGYQFKTKSNRWGGKGGIRQSPRKGGCLLLGSFDSGSDAFLKVFGMEEMVVFFSDLPARRGSFYGVGFGVTSASDCFDTDVELEFA